MRYVPDQGKINHVFGLPYSFTSPELQAEMSFSYHIFFIACLFVELWYHYPGWVRDCAPGYAVSGEENGDVYKKKAISFNSLSIIFFILLIVLIWKWSWY